MKNYLLYFILIFLVTKSFSQVGIGTTTPDASSSLDISSTNSGLLIPRVSLVNVTNGTTPINAPATSLLVYNTNVTITGGNGEGYYYWSGTQWTNLTTPNSNDWSINGNAGTNPSINFIGTTDNNDIIFKRNNVLAGKISNSNTSFGSNSLTSNTTGFANTGIGAYTLSYNTTGLANVANGFGSLNNNTTGSLNTANGYNALIFNSTGSRNTAVGSGSLQVNDNGNFNVAFGASSLVSNTAGNNNVAIGNHSLGLNNSGNSNTALGYYALQSTKGSNNIGIGYYATVPIPLVDNQLSIANVIYGADMQTTATGKISIGNPIPDNSAKLEVTATDKGLLIPRVSLSDIYDNITPINNPAQSLLVYNTNPFVVNGTGEGYYYWYSTQWTKLFDANNPISQYWTKSGSNLFPTTITDNIGIGTTTPSNPLTVKSNTFANIATFDGANQMYITLSENGLPRGYLGSFSGNPEDIELGTYSGNLGAVHLTTNNTPKLTVINNGNVGIGTPSPTEKLDIAGKIKITDGTEGIGKVLVSDAVGVASWVTTNSIKSAVAGVFFGPGANIGAGTAVGVSSPSSYCNAYIDLPPGRWMVFGTYLINNSTTPLTSGQSVWVRCVFSLSNVASLPTSDVISGGLISGTLTGPDEFGIANGQTIIQNPNPIGGATKRYYVWSAVQKYGTTTTAFFVNGLGSSFWGENQLTAIPMN